MILNERALSSYLIGLVFWIQGLVLQWSPVCVGFSTGVSLGWPGSYSGKARSIYVAPFILCIVSKRSDMDHTVLPTNYTMHAFHL